MKNLFTVSLTHNSGLHNVDAAINPLGTRGKRSKCAEHSSGTQRNLVNIPFRCQFRQLLQAMCCLNTMYCDF